VKNGKSNCFYLEGFGGDSDVNSILTSQVRFDIKFQTNKAQAQKESLHPKEDNVYYFIGLSRDHFPVCQIAADCYFVEQPSSLFSCCVTNVKMLHRALIFRCDWSE
jgi:hypothetical protein